ncbi:Trk system potassium uptake protein TrkA [Thioalkalivibrio nitratireducens DSM 14787]|uniref:Trk system potassium uptake protein TrkA n=1 Tax=Thioalkalivibrio nitratireducens (strain DSM 14787 / UNIQEM 213 / ALEN2) TaxID=1255043 RepID=L0DX43_THIND|nr:Trk system potassium transporter TrkA [Thioalkalivibrio nitratireducens]AGA33535.1 Trk system potassium uptake protein TrkA [Thioalkalivibrio nitratireducens DSM 14787]
MKKIIILGAGQVGYSLAEALGADGHEITVVDRDPRCLEVLRDDLGVRVVAGFGAHPPVLKAAGAEDAELLVAVTDSDEVNMMACQVASTLFNVETRIARARAEDYRRYPQLFARDAVPVDMLISPEEIVTTQIHRLIQHPGALQVLDFAGGRVALVAVRAYREGPLVGRELRRLRGSRTGVETRVAAIFRRDRPVPPDGDTVIEGDDEVFFVAAKRNIRAVMSELRHLERPYRRVVIAGGGNIGRRLGETLGEDYHVKLIERDPARAALLAVDLPTEILVLEGDASDDRFLEEIGVEHADVFCAVTNDDQANIFAGMLAKRRGVRKVISLINRPSYVDLVQSGTIDIAISPQLVTVAALLAKVREGGTTAVHSLRRGAAEAIETVVHGDAQTSQVVDRTVADLELPGGTSIGALVRGDEVIIPHHDTVVRAGDHAILFLADAAQVPAVQRLFQPSPLFF